MSRNPSEKRTIKKPRNLARKHCQVFPAVAQVTVGTMVLCSISWCSTFNSYPTPYSLSNQRCAGKGTHSQGAVQALNRQRILSGSLGAWSAAVLLRLVSWTPGLQSHHSPQKSLREAGIYMYRCYAGIPGVPTATWLTGFLCCLVFGWVFDSFFSNWGDVLSPNCC